MTTLVHPISSRPGFRRLLLAGLLTACVSPAAGAGTLYLSLGVGAVGYNDLVDRQNNSVHDTPVGRAALSYQMRVNTNVSVSGTVQHFSSLQANDGGMNWAGVELGVRF